MQCKSIVSIDLTNNVRKHRIDGIVDNDALAAEESQDESCSTLHNQSWGPIVSKDGTVCLGCMVFLGCIDFQGSSVDQENMFLIARSSRVHVFVYV